MSRSEEIAKRLREVFINGLWIANTNYQDQLLKADWETAIRQFDNLNSLAALTFHINYYLEGILQVFKGGKLEIQDKYSFDLPAITSEKEWKELRESLFQNAELFAQQVAHMPDEKLDEIFVEEKYGSYLRNIEGLMEHSYYHLGQIVLIMKLLKAGRTGQQ